MSKGKKFDKQWNSNNSLFGIYIGSNDIYDINFIETNQNVLELLEQIINVVFNITEKMYENGARNFIFINIAPLDEAPINSNGKYSYFKDEIFYYNKLLNIKSENLFNKYNDINIIVYNNNNEYKYIMENYRNFEFLSGKKGWFYNKTIDQNEFFWRDATHITNKGNKIIAEDINDLLFSLNK